MTDQAMLTRIVSRPSILARKPTVRGTRLSVEYILNLLAHGATQEEILAEYAGLTPEDITACRVYSEQAL